MRTALVTCLLMLVCAVTAQAVGLQIHTAGTLTSSCGGSATETLGVSTAITQHGQLNTYHFTGFTPVHTGTISSVDFNASSAGTFQLIIMNSSRTALRYGSSVPANAGLQTLTFPAVSINTGEYIGFYFTGNPFVQSASGWVTYYGPSLPPATSLTGYQYSLLARIDYGGGSGGSGSQTFSYMGGVQSFTVPACVTKVTLDVYGAQGTTTGLTPGYGGRAKGDLTVSGGQILSVYVGGQSGWNGGGTGQTGANGGGASDVRVGGTALTDRVIVAGGGGGAGQEGTTTGGGSGHGGGGTAVGSNFVGGGGGNGYGFYGQPGATNGGTSGTATHGGGGGGGGLLSGGAGATATYYGTYTAASGSLGIGGDAYVSSGCPAGTGAGGGGYYGGGGASGGNCGAGQGGGGSSWTGTLANPSFQAGVRSGHGQVIITW